MRPSGLQKYENSLNSRELIQLHYLF